MKYVNQYVLWLSTIHNSFPRRLKKFDSIHTEDIKIYADAFRTSPLESLHVEAIDPSLELGKERNETEILK